jgi:hypothetical protein
MQRYLGGRGGYSSNVVDYGKLLAGRVAVRQPRQPSRPFSTDQGNTNYVLLSIGWTVLAKIYDKFP